MEISPVFLLLSVSILAALLGGVVGAAWVRRRAAEVLTNQQQANQLMREQAEQHWLAQREQLLDEKVRLERQLDEAKLQQQDLLARTERAEKAEVAAAERLKQLDQLAQLNRQQHAEIQELRAQNTEVNTRLEQEQKSFEQQLNLLKQAKGDLTREFENLANKIFEDKQGQFKVQSQSLLSANLDPVKQQLKEFRQRIDSVYDRENAERNKLVGQISELQKQTQKIGEDAVNLARALKGDNKAQGNWGEVVLERLLEESGLQKGREYETQVALSDADGKRRNPDVIVRLPENKDIVIDSKVSLIDYERFCSAENDEQKQRALKQHIASLRAHIKGLSLKAYENLDGVRSLDFVFIFIPVEAAFMLALQEEPGLFREAYERQIILVSPTTLLATLRTVESIWRYEKQNKNAEKIAAQAGGLYDQFVLLLESLDDVRRHLDKTGDAFDTACKRLGHGRGNLLKRVEGLKKLGAKTKKAIASNKLELADAEVASSDLAAEKLPVNDSDVLESEVDL